MLRAARAAGARLLLLAGDVFDHNRVGDRVAETAAELISTSGLRTIILPGNHDCLGPGSVYLRASLQNVPGLWVLGSEDSEAIIFEDLNVSVWGRAHSGYADMYPLRDVPGRIAGRHVVMAHGHWVTEAADEYRSWRIYERDLASIDADYIALGHWDRPLRLDSRYPAHYSGSPELARTINLVSFAGHGAEVSRLAVDVSNTHE